MAWLLRNNQEILESTEIDRQQLKALNDETRIEILKLLAEKKSYPAEVAKKLDVSKQKAYYHFEILEDSDLIEEKDKVKKSGGLATLYTPSSSTMHLDLGAHGEKTSFKPPEKELKQFLKPLIEEGTLKGFIVTGSPEEHGPDQVSARDGHLAGEIGMELGRYAQSDKLSVKWDTEIVREEGFDQNLLILGGILTNTVARKFNSEFRASFEGEKFPYRKLKTPEKEYTDPEIGVIAKTENPENPENSIYMVAGIRNKGTEAAVNAFKQLEDIIETDTNYIVVEGMDMDGDGKIDDYKVLEMN